MDGCDASLKSSNSSSSSGADGASRRVAWPADREISCRTTL